MKLLIASFVLATSIPSFASSIVCQNLNYTATFSVAQSGQVQFKFTYPVGRELVDTHLGDCRERPIGRGIHFLCEAISKDGYKYSGILNGNKDGSAAVVSSDKLKPVIFKNCQPQD